ncbi:hypothetical protein HK105_207014 [Polyrhizophydium stewartii]|uniref:VPS37 C-terminal domain-containing protein n=1 Tax=Polyrhizophydium stewartii TaxID=2732419 RepID=A0ABR4N227_9FUNG
MRLDELGDLLADDAAVDDYVAGLPQVREIHGARMGIVEDNAAIAERNLAKEEEIKDLRQRIKALQDMHASHRRSLDQLLKAQQQELARFGGEHITGTLRELVTSSESMSELSAQSFLEGKLTEDEFIRAFKESRRVYHLRSAKHEAPVFDYDEIDDLEFENLLNTPGLAGPLHARPSSAVFWDSVASLFRLRPNTGLGLSSNAGSAASAASGLFGAGARAYAYGYEALATTAPALGSAGGGGGSLFGIHFGAGTPAAAHAAPAAASDRLDDLDDVLYGGHDEDSRLMTPEEINSITAAAAAARHLVGESVRSQHGFAHRPQAAVHSRPPEPVPPLSTDQDQIRQQPQQHRHHHAGSRSPSPASKYLTDDSGSTLTAGHGAVVTDPLNAAILFADSGPVTDWVGSPRRPASTASTRTRDTVHRERQLSYAADRDAAPAPGQITARPVAPLPLTTAVHLDPAAADARGTDQSAHGVHIHFAQTADDSGVEDDDGDALLDSGSAHHAHAMSATAIHHASGRPLSVGHVDNASAANEISDDGDEAFATPQQFDADLLRRLQSVAEQ